MAEYEKYYVPAQSRLPILMASGMFISIIGAANMLIDMKNGDVASSAHWVFFAGSLLIALTMYVWFSKAITENLAGMNSGQLKTSYRMGMMWFICSEVMFFAAFFGALFYIRVLVLPWLGGEGAKGVSNELWQGFKNEWPLLSNPDNSLFTPPQGVIHWMPIPLINTALLVTSSITVSIAHHAIKKDNRKAFIGWLAFSVFLGLIFVGFQASEYNEALNHLGLTLDSGIYGSTFFILTGFHGAHVIIGGLMLMIMLIRALKGHFSSKDHFGFEAASWYWHFVDVVWIILFFVVYIF